MVVSDGNLDICPTSEEILRSTIRNIVDGYVGIEALEKLPLDKFNEDYIRCGKNMRRYILRLFSTLSNKQLGRFKDCEQGSPLVEMKNKDVEDIKEILKNLQSEVGEEFAFEDEI